MRRERINRQLLERLRADPDHPFKAILTVDGEPERFIATLAQMNLNVTRTFRLSQKLAVTGRAGDLLRLANEKWALKLEEDRPIKTARNN